MRRRSHDTATTTPISDLLEFEVVDHPTGSATTVVHLHGEIDHSNAWWVSGIVEAASLSGARSILLDLADLRFADSSLVDVLDACDATLRPTGVRVRATRPVPCVARVFQLLDAEHHLSA